MQPHSQELGAGGAGGGRVEITEDYRRFDSMGAVRGHVQSPKGTVPQSGEEALSTAGLGAQLHYLTISSSATPFSFDF